MSRPVRSAALQAADFLAAVRIEMVNDSHESVDYSEDNDNMNQNNTQSEEVLPEKEVEIATQDPDDTSEDEIAVPMSDSTQQTNNDFLSTDGSQRWSKVSINPNTGRMRLQNVLNPSPGPISAVVQRSDSVLGTFSCFITTEMLTKIAHYTNDESQTQIPNSWVDVSVDELRKYLGLRLLAGVYSANKEAITHLWNKDEQLVLFRGRCPFRVYIPSKPGKYGIRIWVLADVASSCCCAFDVYTGKIGNLVEVGIGQRVVLQLTENYYNSGRNNTADNFFSSYSLVSQLSSKKLTYVGTVRKNKKFLQLEFQTHCSRPMGSSVFGFQENISIVCYTPKARKSVTLISSMHYEPIVAESEPFKPEIIQFYNQTKRGVDNLDKLVRTYSSIRKCNRWPVTLFFYLIDIAAYNALVCYVFLNPNYHKGKLSRRRFLEELAFQLNGKDTHNAPDTSNPPSTSTSNRRKKRRCLDCPRKDDKKTPELCNKCEKPICKNRTKTFCFGCCDSN